ncbi:hypothetical protein [Companilactobacillus sp. HBUAS56275]
MENVKFTAINESQLNKVIGGRGKKQSVWTHIGDAVGSFVQGFIGD